ncbi:MAG: cysteine--tRNA ligase [Verrucomicrobiales bacterium]
MTLHLYDTLSRANRPVVPLDGKTLRFYCCGPTVYGPAHIGNFRTFVVQDVFRRVVDGTGLATRHVRNLTDVDDKTIRGAQAEGRSLVEFTSVWRDKFHADCAALGCLPPHVEPSAVAHVPQQIVMIEKLIASGHAYATDDGSVYFKIASFPNYGRLSHLDTRELRHGATVATDEYESDKEGVADFALWKARKPDDGENFWPSPWGDGRPGWHLECSAMALEYLGETFDLHSGGVDLVFPHHENEIAQSECCTGRPLCAHWFHVTHLLVDGRKMSKSLGNLYTLDDLAALGHHAMAVRWVLLNGHYRQPLNFTLENLAGARSALARLAKFTAALESQAAGTPADPRLTAPVQSASEALLDDLNVPKALGQLFSLVNETSPASLTPDEAAETLAGVRFIVVDALGLALPAVAEDAAANVPPEIRALAEKRWAARTAKDWATADSLRAELGAHGWSMKDGKESYTLTRG